MHGENGEVQPRLVGRKRRRKAAKIDRDVNWTRESILKLISAVSEFRALWDVRCSEYRDLLTRTSNWRRIEVEIFDKSIPFEQLKKKWQLLCQSHAKHVAITAKAKSDGEAQPRISWEYWNAMRFLRQAKADKNNIDTDAAWNETSNHELVKMDESVASSLPAATEVGGTPMVSFPRTRATEQATRQQRVWTERCVKDSSSPKWTVAVSPIECSTRTNSSAINPGRPDKFDNFGDFIASSLRNMSPDFAERAMAELNYSMAVYSKKAAEFRLKLTRSTINSPSMDDEDEAPADMLALDVEIKEENGEDLN